MKQGDLALLMRLCTTRTVFRARRFWFRRPVHILRTGHTSGLRRRITVASQCGRVSTHVPRGSTQRKSLPLRAGLNCFRTARSTGYVR